MKAFYLRVGKCDLQDAVAELLKARDVRKYIRLVIGDLTRCYQRLGWWPQFQGLVREQKAYIGRNPVLLDVQAGLMIAQSDWQAAEQEFPKLNRKIQCFEAHFLTVCLTIWRPTETIYF